MIDLDHTLVSTKRVSAGTSDPDSGSWTYTPNAFGELVTQVNAKSQTTTFT